jgi:hypothetical protein
MKKVKLITWSIVEYPKNSGLFELQGRHEPFNTKFLEVIIPYDFHSFNCKLKIGTSNPDGKQLRNRVTPLESTEYQLNQFIPNDKVTNEQLALEIIKEWTEKPNDLTRFKRGPVLSPCSCDDEE